MKLSDHFTLEEMVESQTAERLGLDNAPPPEAVERLRHLCERVLEPARAALGRIRISSGYRSPTVNDAVGGAPNSDHTRGDAADCVPIRVTKMEFARWVVGHADFDQVILEYGTSDEPAWVHVSASPRRRGETLRVLAGRGYERVDLG